MYTEFCEQLGCAQLNRDARAFGQSCPVCKITGKMPEFGCPCELEEYFDRRVEAFRAWKKDRNMFLVRAGVIEHKITDLDLTKLEGLPAEVLLDYLVGAIKILLEGGRLR